MTNIDEITSEIIGGAIAVHRTMGPGLLESAYQQCMLIELKNRGLEVERELVVPLVYEGTNLDCSYRVDIRVAKCVVLEIKSVDKLQSIHHAQLLTYLKLLDAPVGLIINFNVSKLVDGLKRMINDPARRRIMT